MTWQTLAIAWVMCAMAASAGAAEQWEIRQAGVVQLGVPTSLAEAQAVTLDFTSNGQFPGVVGRELIQLTVLSSTTGVMPRTLHLAFEDGSNVSFDFGASQTQLAAVLYDPQRFDPSGYPSVYSLAALPAGLHGTLADGKLDADAWFDVDAAPRGLSQWTLSASAVYITPEPATLAMLGVGVAAFAGRRRR